MNQLCNKTETTMSSVEIADLTNKRHRDVMRDIRKMLMNLGKDCAHFCAEYQDSSGKTNNLYRLDRFHTEVLVTGYDVKRRAAVIQRWYEVESGEATPWHQQQAQMPDFTDPVIAARAWADSEESRRISRQALEDAKPKVSFYDEVTESNKDYSIAEAAKLFDSGRNDLMAALRDIGWVLKKKKNEPSSIAINNGWMTYKMGTYQVFGKQHTSITPRVTAKGLQKLHKMLVEEYQPF